MALDDFSADDFDSEDGDTSDEDGDVSDTRGLLRAVDYHIMQHAEHLPLETNSIPENPTLHVAGDVVIADRTRLNTTIAVAISNFDRDDVKDLEELSMADIQQK